MKGEVVEMGSGVGLGLGAEALEVRARRRTGDLVELQRMLIDSGGHPIDLAQVERQGGLGVFIRRLIGLDRAAAMEAFERYLDGSRFTADQIRFVDLIIDELTKNGVVEPGNSDREDRLRRRWTIQNASASYD